MNKRSTTGSAWSRCCTELLFASLLAAMLVGCSDDGSDDSGDAPPSEDPGDDPATGLSGFGVLAADNASHLVVLGSEEHGRLAWLDSGTDELRETTPEFPPVALAVDEDREVALSLSEQGGVHAFDHDSGERVGGTGPLDHPVDRLLVDADRSQVLVIAPDGRTSFVSLDTFSVTAGPAVDGEVRAAALWQGGGVAYLGYRPAGSESDRLAVVNLASGEIQADESLPAPVTDLLVAPDPGVLLLAGEGNPALRALDLPARSELATFSLDGRPHRLVLQPRTRHAVVLTDEPGSIALLDLYELELESDYGQVGDPRASTISTRTNELLMLSGDEGALERVRLPSPQPRLDSVDPQVLQADDGEVTLTLQGDHFVDGAELELEGDRLPTRWIDHDMVKADIDPEGFAAQGYASVRVHNPDPAEAPSDSLTVTAEGAEPRIDAVSPGEGPGGSVITIDGARFSPDPSGNTVTVGGARAVVAEAAPERLRVVVPLNAVDGPVQVATDQGSAQSDQVFVLKARQDFAIALSDSTIRLPFAGLGSIVVQLESTGLDSYDYPVQARLEGVPEGVNAEMSRQGLSRRQGVRVTVSGEAEAGEYNMTLVAEGDSEDGTIRHEHDLTLEVLPPSTTAVHGRVVHADDDRPLEGVKVTLGEQTVATDAAGEYLFVDPPATGDQVVLIDGDALNTEEYHYPSRIPMPVLVEPGYPNQVLTAYLAPVETDIYTDITPGEQASVTRDDIPGYELRIPDGAVMMGWDDEPIDRINVRQVHPDRLPIRPVPEGVTTNSVYMYYFYRPGGAEPSEPIPVTMQNDLGLDPGDQAVMWYYDEVPEPDPDSNQWRVMGTGTVSADGERIVSDPGVGIPRFCCGASFATPDDPPDAPPGGDEPGCPSAGNPVDLASGSGSVLDDHDLRVGGDPELGVGIRYSSLSDREGPFGIGTYADFEWVVELSADQATVIKPHGVRYNLVHQGGGVYRQETGRRGGFGMEVQRDGDQAVLRRGDGQQMRFGVGGQLDGLLLAVEDERGRTLARFERDTDEGARVATISDDHGRRYELDYNDDQLVTRINCPIGREQRFDYDGDRLVQVTDFGGNDTAYTWKEIEGRFQIAARTNADGHTTRFGYVIPPPEADPPPGAGDDWAPQRVQGRVDRQELPDGGVYRFEYTPSWRDSVSNTVVTRPGGQQAHYFFNSDGYETRREDTLGRTWERRYNPSNNFLEQVTDPLGRTTRFNHDSRGNVTAWRDAAGHLTEITYHPRYNKPTRMTDPLGRETRFEYDAYGELMAVTNAAGERYQFARDSDGRPIRITDPAGNAVAIAYDAYGNVNRITDAQGNSHHYDYDRAGRRTSETDALGRTTRYAYDDLDRLTRITQPSGGEIMFTYTPMGRTATVRDPKGAMIERNTFDGRGRLVSRVDALGGEHQYEYDVEGNLIRHTDARGQATTFEYDAANRLTRVEDSDGRTTSYRYDHADRLVQVKDSEQGEHRYSYDSLDRLVREISDRGTVEYEYDAAGQVIERRVNDREVTRYDYDLAGRVTRIEHDGREARYEYDAAGRLRAKHLPNGMVQRYERDAAGQVLALVYVTPGGAELERIDYEYDGSGSRVAREHDAGHVVQDTDFDAEYDDANRLIALDGYALEYDANGNLVRRETEAGAVEFEWNARNRLVAITAPDYEARFAYDHMGRRILREVDGEPVQYLYDGRQAIAELDSAGSIQAMYHTGLMIDEVLARYTRTRDRALLTDALGSVIALADEQGNVTRRYNYSPYGETEAFGEPSANPVQYTSRENDGTGLYYYRARYYDPELNRFLSPDPIGLAAGDVNLYRYVTNEPVDLVDPTGERGARRGPGGIHGTGPGYYRGAYHPRLGAPPQNNANPMREHVRNLRERHQTWQNWDPRDLLRVQDYMDQLGYEDDRRRRRVFPFIDEFERYQYCPR